jgi:acyl-CoA oxidase
MQEIEALAAGMKILLGAQRLFYRNVEAIGGKGYLSENRIDALKMILKSTPLLRVIIQY